MKGKAVIVFPMARGGARATAAGLRAFDVAAEVAPPSDARTLELGARFTEGDECYPAKVTVGDFMKRLERHPPSSRATAVLMPTADGPCRFGQYAPSLRRVLDANGYAEVGIVSPTSRTSYNDLGRAAGPILRTVWRALVASEILDRLLLQHRPYETEPGSADAAYEESLTDLCAALERAPTAAAPQLRDLTRALERGRLRFAKLATDPDPSRPLIAVVGEIFCRLNTFSNEDAVRHIEEAGAEVWQCGITEWLWYTVAEQFRKLRLRGQRYSVGAASVWLRARAQHRDERRLLEPFRRAFTGYEEPDVADVLAAAGPYLPADGALGEMVLSVGRAVCLGRRGVDGVVDLSPFSCMNGIVCEAVYPRVSRDLDGLPIRTLYFDGTPTDFEASLPVFLHLAQGYGRRKRVPRPHPLPMNQPSSHV